MASIERNNDGDCYRPVYQMDCLAWKDTKAPEESGRLAGCVSVSFAGGHNIKRTTIAPKQAALLNESGAFDNSLGPLIKHVTSSCNQRP